MNSENGFVGNPLRKDQQCTNKPDSDAIGENKDTLEICSRSIQKRHLIAGLIAFLIVAIIIVVPCVILIPKKGRVKC
jgi:hypothetical protein